MKDDLKRWREHERWRLQADQDDADDAACDTVFMLTLGGVLLLLLVGIAALARWMS